MLLIAAIAALLAGPLLVSLGALGPRPRAFIDGFVFVTVAGLFLFGVLPEAGHMAGPVVWLCGAAGFVLPVALESGFVRAARQAHRAILILGVVGLLVHQLLDGVALVEGGSPADGHAHAGGHGDDLALAVVLHNLPVGIAVWFLLAPAFGARVALAVFAVMVGGTVAGFFAGPDLLAALEAPAVAAFQALLAGSILHVVLHGAAAGHHNAPGLAQVHRHDDGVAVPAPRWVERLGMLAGLGLLAGWL
jgi:hypothetical protein